MSRVHAHKLRTEINSLWKLRRHRGIQSSNADGGQTGGLCNFVRRTNVLEIIVRAAAHLIRWNRVTCVLQRENGRVARADKTNEWGIASREFKPELRAIGHLSRHRADGADRGEIRDGSGLWYGPRSGCWSQHRRWVVNRDHGHERRRRDGHGTARRRIRLFAQPTGWLSLQTAGLDQTTMHPVAGRHWRRPSGRARPSPSIGASFSPDIRTSAMTSKAPADG